MMVARGRDRGKPFHPGRYLKRGETAAGVFPAFRLVIQVKAVDGGEEIEGMIGAIGQDSGMPEFSHASCRLGERWGVEREGLGERCGDLGDGMSPIAQLQDYRRGVVELVHPRRLGLTDDEAIAEFGDGDSRGPQRPVPGHEGEGPPSGEHRQGCSTRLGYRDGRGTPARPGWRDICEY
jgi:hypothetical protein